MANPGTWTPLGAAAAQKLTPDLALNGLDIGLGANNQYLSAFKIREGKVLQ